MGFSKNRAEKKECWCKSSGINTIRRTRRTVSLGQINGNLCRTLLTFLMTSIYWQWLSGTLATHQPQPTSPHFFVQFPPFARSWANFTHKEIWPRSCFLASPFHSLLVSVSFVCKWAPEARKVNSIPTILSVLATLFILRLVVLMFCLFKNILVLSICLFLPFLLLILLFFINSILFYACLLFVLPLDL